MKLRIIEKKFKDGSTVYVIQRKDYWLTSWENHCYEPFPDSIFDPILIPIYYQSYQEAWEKLTEIISKYILEKNSRTIEKISILHQTKID